MCFLQLILRVWRPIPPSDDYVALGFVGSATPAAPPAVAAESLRCVHRSLVVTDASVPEMTVTSTATGWNNGVTIGSGDTLLVDGTKNAYLLHLFILKMIILPRQARDKDSLARKTLTNGS